MKDSIHTLTTRNYKFKELKIYCSTEWLADNKKKYRQVYDRWETTFIYAELSIFNKKFDIENWEANVLLKCYSIHRGKKEVCKLQFSRKINKYDHIVYIREGWGNKKPGAFWKKGSYYWEAWIDGENVGKKYFYVEDTGYAFDFDSIPYLKLTSLRLYEGPHDDTFEDDRIYYRTFNGEETRYIYAEATFDNLFPQQNWQCELFFKFFNEARELKGQIVRLHGINKESSNFMVTAGWGSNMKNSWRHGKYTIDLIFMDYLLASVPFEIAYDFEEGVPPVFLPYQQAPIILEPDDTINLSFSEVMARLESLIGLEEIKQQVKNHAQYIQFVQLRKEKGFTEKDEINVHSAFLGNPGTGKTTVAKMMGILYKKMGLLSKGHIHEVDRVDLVGEYIGQTAPKVKEAIEKARGGVLFIDEAYSLARSNDDSKDFGREVIELLVKEMSDGPGDLAVIVAGYPKEMKHFINSNPGLKSRFKIQLEFPDYLPQELSQIAEYACQEKEVILSPDAKSAIDKLITEAYRNRDHSFGNARWVNDLIDKAKLNLALRVMQEDQPDTFDNESLSILILDDVEKIKESFAKPKPKIPIDEALLTTSLEELNALIGLEQVKKEIRQLVDIVRYYQEYDKDVLNSFFLHTVFVGNPGTGKTTVARILTHLYKSLGILERGHMVETDRQGLIAGYVGQTAIKTAAKIDEAMGGVLFIDEAYSLTQHHSHHDYGAEAIQTLLKRMEDHRGEFFVFAAGYPENMESFLKANPGLSSRFDRILRFDDYTPQDLLAIAIKMINDHDMSISEEAKSHLAEHFNQVYLQRDRYFGNARAVRSLIQDTLRAHNLRIVSEKRSGKNAAEITLVDLTKGSEHFNQTIFQKSAIGFKSNE